VNVSGAESFVGTVVDTMAQAGWSTHFSPEHYVYCEPDDKSLESRCLGYTCEEARELWLAIGHGFWLSLLVHEYSHFLIWRDRTKAQRTRAQARYDPALDLLEMWTKRKKSATRRQIVGAAQRVAHEEAITELMALRTIRRYGLPIDVDRYIQRATSYMLTFGFIVQNRRWTNPVAYETEAIWSELPTDLRILKNPRAVLKNYRPYAHLYEKYCMKPWNA